MPETIKAPRGLAGVIADTTSISKVIPELSKLIYRGYAVDQLAERSTADEVAYMLVNGDMPSASQLADFLAIEKSRRRLSKNLNQVLELFPTDAHPMDVLQTAIGFLGTEDDRIWDTSQEVNYDKYLNLYAKIPTIIAAQFRLSQGEQVIPPDDHLSRSANFFHMCFGEVPDEEIVKAFDISLILYAEHSFNASTFTTRVVTSTLSDMYSAISAGVGALKGPLHGGANEKVMHVLLDIDDPEKAESWMLEQLANKVKVMGFGHRVYRLGDSRVPSMKKCRDTVARIKGVDKWTEISNILEKTMIEQKGIYPNLDFPAGPAYYLMGFPINVFTPIFVMSRISGWCAHVMEQAANNRIIRPLSEYIGPELRNI